MLTNESSYLSTCITQRSDGFFIGRILYYGNAYSLLDKDLESLKTRIRAKLELSLRHWKACWIWMRQK